MLGVAGDVLKLSNYPVENKTFPLVENSKDSMINGTYYLTFNENTTVKEIHEFIYGIRDTNSKSSSK